MELIIWWLFRPGTAILHMVSEVGSRRWQRTRGKRSRRNKMFDNRDSRHEDPPNAWKLSIRSHPIKERRGSINLTTTHRSLPTETKLRTPSVLTQAKTKIRNLNRQFQSPLKTNQERKFPKTNKVTKLITYSHHHSFTGRQNNNWLTQLRHGHQQSADA